MGLKNRRSRRKGALPRLATFRSQSAEHQARMAVVLLVMIPVLSLYAGMMRSSAKDSLFTSVAVLAIMLCVVISSVAGWLVLREYSRSIGRLRRYVSEITAGKLPEFNELSQTREIDDLQCIETGFNIILQELEKRIDQVEQKLKVEDGLRKALEQQQ